jgi:hypothetical protein
MSNLFNNLKNSMRLDRAPGKLIALENAHIEFCIVAWLIGGFLYALFFKTKIHIGYFRNNYYVFSS